MIQDSQNGPQISSRPLSQGFQFECPLTVFKADSAPEGKQRRIAGIVSTDRVDQQNEQILQDGLDWDPLLRGGWLNDNHLGGTTDILGYPEQVSYHAKGSKLPDGSIAEANCHWVEGYLLDTKRADAVWELAQALAKTKRRLGYSVEGSIEQRTGVDDSVITKAKVRNIAITNCLLGDVTVSGVARGVSRRVYDGPIYEMKLKSGHSVTGTPNHPVLTQMGWVGLGQLDKRIHRVCRSLRNGVTSAAVDQYVDDVPARLDQIFDAAEISERVKDIRPGCREDFHGDGSDGNVDVVKADRLLRDTGEAAFAEHFSEDGLTYPDAVRVAQIAISNGSSSTLFSRLGQSVARGIGVFCTLLKRAKGIFAPVLLDYASINASILHYLVNADSAHPVFSSQVATPLAFGISAEQSGFVLRGNLRPAMPAGSGSPDEASHGSGWNFQQLSNLARTLACRVSGNDVNLHSFADLRDRRACDAGLMADIHHASVADADGISDDGSSFARRVAFEDISALSVRNYSGHVYNLDSVPGWYVANGVVLGNCPVNTDARLEILARSLTAQNTILRRSMTITDATGSAGPVKPNRPYTGQGAGQVLTPEHLQGAKPKRKKPRSMSRKQAVAYVKSVVPGLPEVLVRAIIHRTLHPQGRE